MRSLTIVAAAVTGGLGGIAGLVGGVAMGAAEAASSFDDARLASVLGKAGAVSQQERDVRVVKAWASLGVGTAISVGAGTLSTLAGGVVAIGGRSTPAFDGLCAAAGLLLAEGGTQLAELGFEGIVDAPDAAALAGAQLTVDLWRLGGQQQTLRRQWRRAGGADDAGGEARLAQVVVMFAAARNGQLARAITDQTIGSDFCAFARAALWAGIPAQPR